MKPYNAHEKCPKCGYGLNQKVRYYIATDKIPERLFVSCSRCGYIMGHRAPLDKEEECVTH